MGFRTAKPEPAFVSIDQFGVLENARAHQWVLRGHWDRFRQGPQPGR